MPVGGAGGVKQGKGDESFRGTSFPLQLVRALEFSQAFDALPPHAKGENLS